MKFTKTKLAGVFLIQPKVFKDKRGLFFEDYNQKVFKENGIDDVFVQSNQSRSSKGVLRGLHYQIKPRAQAKLVQVTRGQVFDVVVDIRKGSRTFGQYVSTLLTGDNQTILYVPEGFAHGFLTLTDNTEFHYYVSNFYSPEHERGIAWNDSTLNIKWPKLKARPFLSDKDKALPTLNEVITAF